MFLLRFTVFGQAELDAPTLEARIDALVPIPPDRPGAVVAIMRDGRAVFAKAYGLADLTHRVAFDTATHTNLDSTSKQWRENASPAVLRPTVSRFNATPKAPSQASASAMPPPASA